MSAAGVVAAGHEKTVEAAALILEAGGNAFDGALAAVCAACVAEPVLTSLGGGGFLLAHDGRRSRLYDFFAHTPLSKRSSNKLDFFPIVADFGGVHQEFHIGLGSIATPGIVRGLFAVHRDLGTVPLRRIIEPAVHLARNGIVIDELQAYIFRVVEPIYSCSTSTAAIYGSPSRPGKLLAQGERFVLPDFADVLETLALEGERLFYEGEIARGLVDACQGRGGHLRAADLAHYRVEIREPLQRRYRDALLVTNPPPSCGGILIALALGLLERTDIGKLTYGSPEHLMLLASVMELTNRARVETNLRELAPDQQEKTLLDPQLLDWYRAKTHARYAALRGTTHISVVDGQGNAASLTVSNGEGSGYVIPGTGIMTNNMLGEEDINPHGFHNWKAGQRIASMMSPSLLFWPDGRVVAMGSGGSNRIRTAILQVLINLVDFGMAVETSVHAPRVHFENDELNVEGGFPPETLEALAAAFSDHHFWDRINLFFGGVHTVEFFPGSSRFEAAGDPRRGGFWTRV